MLKALPSDVESNLFCDSKMSERILVLSEGRISGELTKENFSQENVLTLASGLEVTVRVCVSGKPISFAGCPQNPHLHQCVYRDPDDNPADD